MPTTALKHLAKKAKVSLDRAEHLWDKSKEIVDKEYKYDKKDSRYWALRMGITKRMLGLAESLSFRQFLEAAVGPQPNYSVISQEDALEIINSQCSKSKWMLRSSDYAIFRGESARAVKMGRETGFLTVDPSATLRKSENTTNYYTVILDNTPSMSHYPKRSRSFIASTNIHTSSHFSYTDDHDGIFVLVPYNKTKIGVCNYPDIWLHEFEMFGEKFSFEDAAFLFLRRLGIRPDTWEAIVKFADDLKREEELQKLFYAIFKKAKPGDHERFLEEIDFQFAPERLGFELEDGSSIRTKAYDDNEVWVGGPCIAVSYTKWQELLKNK